MNVYQALRVAAFIIVVICFMLITSSHTSIATIGMGLGGGVLIATTIMIEGDMKDKMKKTDE
ncbi:hypothetical protein LCM20_08675 [Halobacillus litoralis]|uniref:hypothetical protein n=1 Tax=Halobacillus litoralis TaxID=45668 RepID=UPI001CD61520|nr:hypothetical protein [Halobacillus litoralis]MCA0970659.1 hypothetical protein [Halobacillus litoralis]